MLVVNTHVMFIRRVVPRKGVKRDVFKHELQVQSQINMLPISMRQETEGEEHTRVSRDVKTPSSA